jgi:[citrate (pro-3S)-lyase] ligase
MILSELMQELARRGVMHYFIFTLPSKAHLFTNLGFNEIARAEPYAALLESGLGSIKTYCDSVAREAAHLPEKRAAIVVNCNPFTKGHQALIKIASTENDSVIVFVVSEDRSLFPFEDRLKLVRAGVADLENVVVVPAGKYIVSSATFPTYFTRKEDRVAAQTRLDISLFATRIAPALGICARYVGEEPYCPVTESYNRAMREIFPGYGIELHVMPRIMVDGEYVSASKVRTMIRLGEWERLKAMLPEVTFEYLMAEENSHVIERIRNSDCRH